MDVMDVTDVMDVMNMESTKYKVRTMQIDNTNITIITIEL